MNKKAQAHFGPGSNLFWFVLMVIFLLAISLVIWKWDFIANNLISKIFP